MGLGYHSQQSYGLRFRKNSFSGTRGIPIQQQLWVERANKKFKFRSPPPDLAVDFFFGVFSFPPILFFCFSTQSNCLPLRVWWFHGREPSPLSPPKFPPCHPQHTSRLWGNSSSPKCVGKTSPSFCFVGGCFSFPLFFLPFPCENELKSCLYFKIREKRLFFPSQAFR